MLIVNAFKTDRLCPGTDEMLASLNAVREKIAAMPEGEARTTRLAAHFFLQRELCRMTGVEKLPDYRYTPAGRPYLEGVHFSLSHTAGAAAYIIADQNCAIDIEPLDRRFSPALIKRIGAKGEDPVSVWCKKECLSKLLGGSVLSQDIRQGSFFRFELEGFFCLYTLEKQVEK